MLPQLCIQLLELVREAFVRIGLFNNNEWHQHGMSHRCRTSGETARSNRRAAVGDIAPTTLTRYIERDDRIQEMDTTTDTETNEDHDA